MEQSASNQIAFDLVADSIESPSDPSSQQQHETVSITNTTNATHSQIMQRNQHANEIYITIYDYKANQDDELDLFVGNKIRILSKDNSLTGDDGWWIGVDLSTNKKGILPADYIRPFCAKNEQHGFNVIITSNDNNNENNTINAKNSTNAIMTAKSTEATTVKTNTTTKNTTTAMSYSSHEQQQNFLIFDDDEFEETTMPPLIDYAQLEFGDCIGAGGFGKVFQGYWHNCATCSLNISECDCERHSELVAIKEARVEQTDGKPDIMRSLKKNFLQEAKLFWLLRHPNIIQLKGICLHDQHYCLIMEYAKGGSLSNLLKIRKHGFPPNILIKWALQVSQGMYYLHEQALPNNVPIVHRDLKSSNILLNDFDENSLDSIVLKLTDFGLARELKMNDGEMSAAGTYSHMPPEVIKYASYSRASDVWSFGVLLWELLTGEIPYKGIDPLAIAYGVAVNKLTLPIPSTCPQIFSDLIQGCWSKEPENRLSFEQIISCLTELLHSPFATMNLSDIQQGWKSEIEEMFLEIKLREHELKIREEELERKSVQQREKEDRLRELERQLAEKEKDLAVRELSIALKQLNAKNSVSNIPAQAPPPELKKRRRAGLLKNLLRSSSNNASHNSPYNNHNKSMEISTPVDFKHFLSVQPDYLKSSSSGGVDEERTPSSLDKNYLLKLNSSTESSSATAMSNNFTNQYINISSINGTSSSPNFGWRIMLPGSSKKLAGLVHQRTLSPNASSERVHNQISKSSSVDHDHSETTIRSNRSKSNNQHESSQVNLSQNQQQHQQQQLQKSAKSHSKKPNYLDFQNKSNIKEKTVWYNNTLNVDSADSSHESRVHQSDLSSPALSNSFAFTHQKRIGKIICEIGSILAFIGLGKDIKQVQQTPTSATTAGLSSLKSNPNSASHLSVLSSTLMASESNFLQDNGLQLTKSRRSQLRKQTSHSPFNDDSNSTTCSNIEKKKTQRQATLQPSSTATSGAVVSSSLSVVGSVDKTNVHRFKSLTNRLTNRSTNETMTENTDQTSSSRNNRKKIISSFKKKNQTFDKNDKDLFLNDLCIGEKSAQSSLIQTSNHKLIPMLSCTNEASTQIVLSSDNLLDVPDPFLNSTASSSGNSSDLLLSSNSASGCHQQTTSSILKLMQKKYSKSVDATYTDKSNRGAGHESYFGDNSLTNKMARIVSNTQANGANTVNSIGSTNINANISSNQYLSLSSAVANKLSSSSSHVDSMDIGKQILQLNTTGAMSSSATELLGLPSSCRAASESQCTATKSNTTCKDNKQLLPSPSHSSGKQLIGSLKSSSPLIPRRNDFESITRYSNLQRQQRVTDNFPIHLAISGGAVTETATSSTSLSTKSSKISAEKFKAKSFNSCESNNDDNRSFQSLNNNNEDLTYD